MEFRSFDNGLKQLYKKVSMQECSIHCLPKYPSVQSIKLASLNAIGFTDKVYLLHEGIVGNKICA